jgi:hypothetical protein
MANANFTVNGDAVPPQYSADYSDPITLALVSTSGVRTVAWSIIGISRSGLTLPTITPGGSPSGTTATFTVGTNPGGTLGISYLLQCQVNGGTDDEGTEDSSLTKTALVGVENSVGIVPSAFGETFERDTELGYIDAFNQALNASGGGGSPTAPTNPTDNGKVAVADSGDLDYMLLVNAHIDAAAAIAHTKLADIATDSLLGRDTASTGALETIGVGGGVEFTGSKGIQRSALTGDVTASAGSGTTAIAAGVIVNADVNASAAIAGTKIAPDFGAQAGITTSTWTANELRALQDSGDNNPAEVTGRKAGGGGTVTPDGAAVVYFQAERCTGSSTFVEAGGIRFVYDYADPENSGDQILWTEVRGYDSAGVATISRTGRLKIAIDDTAEVQVMSFAIADGEQVEVDVDILVTTDPGDIGQRMKRTWSGTFINDGGAAGDVVQWGTDVDKFAVTKVGSYGIDADIDMIASPTTNYIRVRIRAVDDGEPDEAIPSIAYITAAVSRIDLEP